MFFKRILRKLFVQNERLCENLNRSQKLYYFGVVFLLLAGFWWLTRFTDIALAVLSLSGIFFTLAIISDIDSVYKKIWNINIGKGLILLVYAITTNLAYAIAAQFITEVVKYDPVKLVFAINFVAVLLVPLFIAAASFVIFFMFFMFGQAYMLIVVQAEHIRSSRCLKGIIPEINEQYPQSTFFIRFLVFPLLLSFYGTIAENYYPSYLKFIKSSTESFIFNFEAKQYSRCTLEDGQRALYVNEKELVVVEEVSSRYIFTATLCKPKLSTINDRN